MIKGMLVAALMAGSIAAVNAQQVFGRVDVSGKAPMELKAVEFPNGGYFMNITWGAEEARKSSLTGHSQKLLPDGAWTRVTFSFIPSADGQVNLSFRGNYSNEKQASSCL